MRLFWEVTQEEAAFQTQWQLGQAQHGVPYLPVHCAQPSLTLLPHEVAPPPHSDVHCHVIIKHALDHICNILSCIRGTWLTDGVLDSSPDLVPTYTTCYYTSRIKKLPPYSISSNSSLMTKSKSKKKSHCDSQSTRYLLLFDSYGFVFVGYPLWREDGSVFCICCWFLPVQSFSGPSPLVLTTIFFNIQLAWDLCYRI
jgi:hypothetical protein